MGISAVDALKQAGRALKIQMNQHVSSPKPSPSGAFGNSRFSQGSTDVATFKIPVIRFAR